MVNENTRWVSLRYIVFCFVDALLCVGVEVLLVVVRGELALGLATGTAMVSISGAKRMEKRW